jgi:phosphotransferase system HPr (HPr) family protein
MTERTVTIGVDLDARPAALFVQAANKYKSHIEVKIGGKTINAKSIMGIFALNIFGNSDITLVANGEDEQQAVEELSVFLTSSE